MLTLTHNTPFKRDFQQAELTHTHTHTHTHTYNDNVLQLTEVNSMSHSFDSLSREKPSNLTERCSNSSSRNHSCMEDACRTRGGAGRRETAAKMELQVEQE